MTAVENKDFLFRGLITYPIIKDPRFTDDAKGYSSRTVALRGCRGCFLNQFPKLAAVK